jgi:tetratricopeptide (TPR) repeat protein
MRWKYPLFALCAVLLFFGIVELVLWAAGVKTLVSERDPFEGFSEQVRVFERDGARDVYATPQRAVLHSFNYQEFRSRKPPNGFRVFVLGGSSAYGFPWGAPVAFPRFLQDALQASWPGKEIEVVNASGMSYGSHRLRILASEVLHYQPDLLIVYEGHNEFVERRFYRDVLGRRPELDGARWVLGHGRLYSLMTRAYEGLLRDREKREHVADPGERSAGELLGLDVDRDPARNVGDAERGDVHQVFEENVRVIVEMARQVRVPVLLCTVPSNVSGWKPNQSAFTTDVTFENRRAVQEALPEGDPSSAISRLEHARLLAPTYADVHFLLGRAYEAQGRWDDARREYVQARDVDAMPTRADSAINDAVRRLGREPGAALVDVERVFEQRAPHGLLGFNYFQDYVHPKPEAHQFIALELWKVIQDKGLAGAKGSADESAFWKALGNGNGEPAPVDLARYVPNLDAKAPALLYNLGVILENQGLQDEALEKYRACRDLGPTHFVEATCSIGRLLSQKERFDEAAAEFNRALDADPKHVKSLMGLAEVMRRTNRPEQAIELFLRATRSDPGFAPAWDRLGVALSGAGRHQEAEAGFRRAVVLDGGNADYLTDLGFALLFERKLPESETCFRKALTLRADHLRARRGLAAVLTEKGAFDDAERIFNDILGVNPGDGDALAGLAILEQRRKAVR